MKIVICNIITFAMLYADLFAGSGGPLTPEQAAYDVKYYDLNLFINPDTKTISGSLLCLAEIVNPVDTLVLDLNNTYTIDSLFIRKGSDHLLKTFFTHSNSKIKIVLPSSAVGGELVTAKVYYHGTPVVSEMPPWDDGFVWNKTAEGKPWAGVACETEGGDLWWPCKDHPSDEPDSMSLSFTVPNPLICVSNGRFLGSTDNGNNTSTFRWFVSTPINNYNVTFYAAEFKLIEDSYTSISGTTIPFYFWVLPESYDKAQSHMGVFRKEFNFLESICGPFPFGTDKHGFAHSPYWGMEHQTIVAYGHDFSLNEWGFDYIHLHESAHEWWGNLITAKDWSDVWIHEGIATYTEALYVEHLSGKTGLYQYMNSHRPANNHVNALAPRSSLSAGEAFFFLNSYNRGSAVLHTMRYYLGDEIFFKVLKGWAYPDSNNTDNTHGRLCRIVSTDDLKNDAEKISGKELDNFFEVFFRQKLFPVLKVTRGENEAAFTWVTENNVLLDVDIPVAINGVTQIIKMRDNKGTAAVSANDHLNIDPQKWILMDIRVVTQVDENDTEPDRYKLGQNYPNPFNPATTISCTLPFTSNVKITVTNSLGEVVKEFNDTLITGQHEFQFDGSLLASGVYFYSLEADALDGSISFKDINKMVLLK